MRISSSLWFGLCCMVSILFSITNTVYSQVLLFFNLPTKNNCNNSNKLMKQILYFYFLLHSLLFKHVTMECVLVHVLCMFASLGHSQRTCDYQLCKSCPRITRESNAMKKGKQTNRKKN